MNRRIFTILLEDVERTLFRSRPTANYEGGGRRCARIPLLLHVSRICIESRHNEADYRKIVHEYLESGQVGRGFHHRMSNESRNIVGTRTDFAMTREERERERERIDWTEMLNDLRTEIRKFQRATRNPRIIKRIESKSRFLSLFDRFMTCYSGTEQFHPIAG